MTLQQVLDFIAVAQHGSLHAAARSMGQAQPGLSKSLRRLEESVGVPLLMRGAKGVRLTPFGERFLTHARLIAAEADRARVSLNQMQGERLGAVRFGISPVTALMLSAPCLLSFRREYPDVRLHSVSGIFHTLAPQLREGQIDFAVCPSADEVPPEFTDVPLLRCDMCVVARVGHPLGGSRSLQDLKGARFVMGSPGGVTGTGIRGEFISRGFGEIQIDMYTDSVLDTLAVVEGSDRLAMIPSHALDSRLLSGPFVRIPIGEQLSGYSVSLIRRSDSPLTPAASALAAIFERESTYLMKKANAVVDAGDLR